MVSLKNKKNKSLPSMTSTSFRRLEKRVSTNRARSDCKLPFATLSHKYSRNSCHREIFDRVIIVIALASRKRILFKSPALTKTHGNGAYGLLAQATLSRVYFENGGSTDTVSWRVLSPKQCQWGTRCEGVHLRSLFPQSSKEAAGCSGLLRTALWSLAVLGLFFFSALLL